jgi:acyl-coenzyme A thioesterase PaaI-like protein
MRIAIMMRSMTDAPHLPPFVRAWMTRTPGQLIGKGHPAGDFLEAYEWKVVEERAGLLRIQAHVPAHVKNPRGQLFGGFTPTYVDLIALFTVRSGTPRDAGGFRTWLATSNMRVDYFEPIIGPQFTIESRLLKKRGRTHVVDTRFFDPQDTLAVFALTTIREVALDRPLGDG